MALRNPSWSFSDANITLSNYYNDDNFLNSLRLSTPLTKSTEKIGGGLSATDIVDFIPVSLSAGREYMFSAVSTYPVELAIYDTSGYLLEYVDGSDSGLVEGYNQDSIVGFTPLYSGDYLLNVGDSATRSYNSYTVMGLDTTVVYSPVVTPPPVSQSESLDGSGSDGFDDISLELVEDSLPLTESSDFLVPIYGGSGSKNWGSPSSSKNESSDSSDSKNAPTYNEVSGSNNADNLSGTTGNDRIDAGGGDDIIQVSGGDDLLSGGAGRDTLKFASVSTSATLDSNPSSLEDPYTHLLTHSDGTISFEGVERLQFSNKNYALDTDSTETGAGMVARLLIASFGSENLSSFLGTGISLADGGQSKAQLLELIVSSNLVSSITGAGPSDEDFVTAIFENVAGSEPNAFQTGIYTSIVSSQGRTAFLELAADNQLTADVMENSITVLGLPYVSGL